MDSGFPRKSGDAGIFLYLALDNFDTMWYPSVMKRLPSNWRSRIEIIEHEPGEFILQFKKGFTPRGFLRYIGRFIVEYKHMEEAYLRSHFRGRGLGIMVYEHILHHYGELSTHYHRASPDAQRVWDSMSLRYPYKADFFTGVLTVMLPAKKMSQSHLTIQHDGVYLNHGNKAT